MKCVIAFSCLLAVASAGYLNHAAPLAYANHGSHAVAYNAPLVSAPHPVHVGYAGPLAHAYAAHTGPVAHGYAHAAPIAHGYAHAAPIAHGYAHAAPLVSEARLIDPVAIAAGAPLPTGDTVEVAAAKAFHHQAHVAAKSLAHSAPIAHAYAHAAPVAHGYAHVAPIAHGYAHGYAHAAPLATQVRLVDPVAIAAGAPLPTGDTVEVAAAKAAHFQAVHAAKAGHYLHKRSPGYLNAGVAVATPLAYAAPVSYAVAAPATSYSYSSQITHATPVHSYGLSTYAAPLAYAGHSGYGLGGHVGAYYG